MNDFLVNLGTMVAIFSALGFIIGCFMIFSEKDRKIGLKLMVFSTVAFIIGFGTCVANFALDTR